MKARHCIFHVECFRCATCDASLRKGSWALERVKGRGGGVHKFRLLLQERGCIIEYNELYPSWFPGRNADLNIMCFRWSLRHVGGRPLLPPSFRDGRSLIRPPRRTAGPPPRPPVPGGEPHHPVPRPGLRPRPSRHVPRVRASAPWHVGTSAWVSRPSGPLALRPWARVRSHAGISV